MKLCRQQNVVTCSVPTGFSARYGLRLTSKIIFSDDSERRRWPSGVPIVSKVKRQTKLTSVSKMYHNRTHPGYNCSQHVVHAQCTTPSAPACAGARTDACTDDACTGACTDDACTGAVLSVVE
jgi:hypothetical protein